MKVKYFKMITADLRSFHIQETGRWDWVHGNSVTIVIKNRNGLVKALRKKVKTRLVGLGHSFSKSPFQCALGRTKTSSSDPYYGGRKRLGDGTSKGNDGNQSS